MLLPQVVAAFVVAVAWATWATWATVDATVASPTDVGAAADLRTDVVVAPPLRIIARRSLVKMELRVETCHPSKLVAPAARVRY